MSIPRSMPRRAATVVLAIALGGALLTPFGFPGPSVADARPATVAIEDPTVADRPQVEVSGTLQKVVASGGEAAPSGSPSRPSSSWSLVTNQGAILPVTVDGDVSSGATYTGTVAIDPETVSGVSAGASTALDESSAAYPVPADSSAAAEIVAAAAEAAEPLELADGEVRVAAADTSGTTANHRVTVVIASPPGVTPVDEQGYAYADYVVRLRAMSGTAYWTNARIPNFTVDSTVTRITTSSCTDPYTITWLSALQALGFANQASFQSSDPGTVRHLLVVLPRACYLDQPWVLAQLGSSIHDGGIAQITSGLAMDVQLTAHALGHNLSIGPANVAICDDDAVSIGCDYAEGRDNYDVMGTNIQGLDNHMGVLSARSQIELGLATVEPSLDFALGSGVASQSWDFTMSSIRNHSTDSFVRISDPLTGDPYLLELRLGEGTATYFGTGVVWGLGLVWTGPGLRLITEGPDNGTDAIAIPKSTPGDFREYGTIDSYEVTNRSAGPDVRNASGTIIATMTGLTASTATVHLELRRPDSTDITPIYRFWSPENRSHFYTASLDERDHIIATYSPSQWTYEGVAYNAFSAPADGRVPLYRFWSPTFHGHFFTTSAAEKDSVIANYPANIWTYEGVAYYVYPEDSTEPNTMTVARFWSAQNRHHFYTANAAERELVIGTYPTYVWNYEGNNFRVPGF